MDNMDTMSISMPSSLLDYSQWTTPQIVLVVSSALIVLAITTRIQSSTATARDSQSAGGDVHNVPAVPYWLPVIGHIPGMVLDATHFLRRLRKQYSEGAFALNLGGTTHNIVYSPSLVTALLNAKDTQASHEHVADSIIENIFGYPMKKEGKQYKQAAEAIRACFHHLLSEEKVKTMVVRTSTIIERTICNFVSFSRSVVDQSDWERVAQCELTTDSQGREVVAADLVELIRNYCAIASNETVIGSDFLKNYPDYLKDLWTVDRAFIYLGAGLPRWVPIPMVTRAHIARRNLIRSFAQFEAAMDKRAAGLDPGPQWSELDDVGPVVQERILAYRQHNLSMEARAAFEFALMWTTNANSNMLVFWMINRIYADKALLAAVRAEIAPYVLATQPKKVLAVAEPPTLSTFDVEGLCSNCPLLKSCYVECLRVDAGTWSFKAVREDFVLSGRGKEVKSFLMRKGDYVHAAHDVHNSDPAYFPDPNRWIADRHVQVDKEGRRTAGLGTIRPYGGGSSMCKGRVFAYKQCMMFAAAILAMWEIEPANGKTWQIPKHRKATGVYGTGNRTRVHLRRRPLAEQS